jgi:hypothetical protein
VRLAAFQGVLSWVKLLFRLVSAGRGLLDSSWCSVGLCGVVLCPFLASKGVVLWLPALCVKYLTVI